MQQCFSDTVTEIEENLVFPISEKSKMRISQSTKVMQIILEGLHEEKHIIDLALVLDLMNLFWYNFLSITSIVQ